VYSKLNTFVKLRQQKSRWFSKKHAVLVIECLRAKHGAPRQHDIA